MEYNLVSADSHMDMSWLPGDLFEKNGPDHLKDAMPKVVDTDQGPRWITEGRELGVYGGLGFGFSAPKRGHRRQVDKMYGSRILRRRRPRHRPRTPPQRHGHRRRRRRNPLRHDHRRHENPQPRSPHRKLPHLQRLGLRLLHRYPGPMVRPRLHAHPRPVLGGKELRRAANNSGIRGGELYVSGTTRPIYLRDGHWDPLWDAAAETGLPSPSTSAAAESKSPAPSKARKDKSPSAPTNPPRTSLPSSEPPSPSDNSPAPNGS